PLPTAIVDVPFTASFVLSGAQGEAYWNLIPANAVPGLTLDRASGELRGTPIRSGRFDFVVEATTSSRQSARKSCSLTVNAAPDVTNAVCMSPRSTPQPPTGGELDNIVTSTLKTDSPFTLPRPMTTVRSSDG